MKDFNMTRRQALAALAAAGLAAAGLAEAGAPARAETDRRQRLTVGMSVFPTSLEPVMYGDTATRRVVPQMFDTLLAFDQANNMALRPSLAERWERIDGQSLRLALRPGVVFHDGRPFTAEDVAFTLSPDHLLGPGKAGRTSAIQTLSTLDRVEVIDPRTVIVHAKGNDGLLEQRLAAWYSEIVSKGAFEAAGSWDKWQAAPVGTGPYRLVAQRTDVHVQLAAHDAYWGGRPPFSAIEYRIVPELASRVNGLLSGELDIVTDVPPDQFGGIEARPALEVVGGAVQNIRLLVIDCTDPVLRDVRVRRALSLAVDRKLMLDTLWDGRLPVPRGYQLPSFGVTYIEDFPAPAYDPDKARALLREAGYAGQPITYRLLKDYYTNQVAGAQTMVEMWRQVGLNVQIEMMENFSQVEHKPVLGLFDNSNTAIFPDPLGQAWREFGPKGEMPVAGLWSNAEYDRLGEEMQTTIDPATRRRCHQRMLQIIAEKEAPVVILYVSGQFYGKRKDVRWAPGQTLGLDFGPFNPALRRS